MKQVMLQYNAAENLVKMDVHSSNIIPGYMYYLLEAHSIPTDTTVQFKDKTVVIEKIKYKFQYKEVN